MEERSNSRDLFDTQFSLFATATTIKETLTATNRSNQTNELVQVICASPGNQGTRNNNGSAQCVLLPFDVQVMFTGAIAKQRLLDDTDSGK